MSEAEVVRLAVPVDERDHVRGPANALVTVVIYGDYECPDCEKTHRAIQKTTRELQDRVRLVIRHFPLVKVHPHALRAAEAAEAAAAQGKFWEMNRLLYCYPDKLEDKNLQRYAKEIGLDVERFNRELVGGIYADQILKDLYFSVTHGITGAPTTFINDVMYAMRPTDLVSQVKAILATAEPHLPSAPL
jgi:protein-disulfide isomerase